MGWLCCAWPPCHLHRLLLLLPRLRAEHHDGHFDHVQCGVVPSAGVLLLLLRHGDKDKGEEGRIIIPNRPVVSLAPPLATQPGHPWPFQLSGF